MITRVDSERTYSVEEFEAAPEFNGLYELVEGKLVEKMSPGNIHGKISRIILRQLDRFDPDEGLGVMWPSTSFNLGDGWIPIPDLGFMTADRVTIFDEKAIQGVPDLVVEVHSPGDLDTTPGRDAAQNKIKKYQTTGVRLIWAINPRNQTVEVYHPDQPQPVQVLSGKDELSGEDIIPGFKFKVNILFKKKSGEVTGK